MTNTEWREMQKEIYGFRECAAPAADRDGCVSVYRRGLSRLPYGIHIFDLDELEKTVSVRFAPGQEGLGLWVMLELQRFGYFVTGSMSAPTTPAKQPPA